MYVVYLVPGYLPMVYYGDSGGCDPQHPTAADKFLFTLSPLIVIVSCILEHK